MSGSSRFSQLISAEAGEIERRLQALEKRFNIAGARAPTNARDTAENLGDAIASALTGWADRFRQGASTGGLHFLLICQTRCSAQDDNVNFSRELPIRTCRRPSPRGDAAKNIERGRIGPVHASTTG